MVEMQLFQKFLLEVGVMCTVNGCLRFKFGVCGEKGDNGKYRLVYTDICESESVHTTNRFYIVHCHCVYSPYTSPALTVSRAYFLMCSANICALGRKKLYRERDNVKTSFCTT